MVLSIYVFPHLSILLTGKNDQGGASFDGLLSDVQVYAGVLSPVEVAALASSKVQDICLQQEPPTLQSFLPLKEDTMDYSGNSLNGISSY